MNDKPTILCIDDEERVLRSLQLLFQDSYTIYTTTSPVEYEQILTTHTINVVICDQRMPNCMGTALLEKTRNLSPDTMRILLTGYADLSDVVDAINKGEIFRYVTKPWDLQDLRDIVAEATALSFVPSASEVPENEEMETNATAELAPAVNDTESDERQKGGVLIVTGDNEHRQLLHEMLTEKFTLYDAYGLTEAREILAEEEGIGVLLTEMTLGGKATTNCISTLKKDYPSVMSIVLTDLQDSGALIDLINTGQIYRCLPKLVSVGMLVSNIKRAVVRHAQLQANPVIQQRYQVEIPAAPVARRSLLSGVFDKP